MVGKQGRDAVPNAASDVFEIGNNKYQTLADAVLAAVDGDTIKALADYDIANTSYGVSYSGKALTIDLNGKTIQNSQGGLLELRTDTSGVAGLPEASLTVMDSSTEKNGKLKAMGYTIEIENAGTVTVQSGTVESTGQGYNAINTSYTNTSSIVITGGSVIASHDFNTAIYHGNAGTITVSGGTVSSKTSNAIVLASTNGQPCGKLIVSGSAVITSNYTATTSGTIAVSSDQLPGGLIVDIQGGTVSNTASPERYSVAFHSRTGITSENAETVYRQADGATVGKILPPPPAFEINGARYGTLAKAVEAAANGDTIKVLYNYDMDDYSTVKYAGKAITIDLNGKTLQNSKSGVLQLDANASGQTGLPEASLTVMDSSTEKDGKMKTSSDKIDTILLQSAGTVTVQSGTVETASDATSYAIRASGSQPGSIIVTGGAVISSSNTSTANYAIFLSNPSTVTISGGTVSAGAGTAICLTSDTNQPCGKVIVSGTAVVTSAATGDQNGTILARSNQLTQNFFVDIQGGTVTNTATPQGNAVAFAARGVVTAENLDIAYRQAAGATVGKVIPKAPAVKIVRNGTATEYYTLQEAIDAVEHNETIVLLRNINEYNVARVIGSSRTLPLWCTIDLNGFNVTAGIYTGGLSSAGYAFQFYHTTPTADVGITLTDNSGGDVGTFTTTAKGQNGALRGISASQLVVSRIKLVASVEGGPPSPARAISLTGKPTSGNTFVIKDGATVTATAKATNPAADTYPMGVYVPEGQNIVIENGTLEAISEGKDFDLTKNIGATSVRPVDAGGTGIFTVGDPTNEDGWKVLHTKYASSTSLSASGTKSFVYSPEANNQTFTINAIGWDAMPVVTAKLFDSTNTQVGTDVTVPMAGVSGQLRNYTGTVTFNMGGLDAGKYSIQLTAPNGSKPAVQSTLADIEIAKADFASVPIKTIGIQNGSPRTGTVSLSELFDGNAPMDAAFGEDLSCTKNIMNTVEKSGSTIVYASNNNPMGTTSTDEATITVSSKNYKDMVVTIKFRAQDKKDAVITAALNSKTYDGTAVTVPTITAVDRDTNADVTLTYTYQWQENRGTEQSPDWVDISEAPKAAGRYKLTLTGSSTTHVGEKIIAFSIAKKELQVIAENKAMYFRNTMPQLTIQYVGFAPGDTAENATTENTYTAATEADGKEVNNFPITVQGSANAVNYTLKPVNGTLRVLPCETTQPVTEMPANPTKETAAIPTASTPTGSNLSDLRLVVSYEVTEQDDALLNSFTSGKPEFENKKNFEISLVDLARNTVVQPNGKITLFIPYPAGTSQDDTFTLLHVKRSNANTSEKVEVKTLSNGLQFTVDSLSPFTLGWTKAHLTQYTITATAGPGGYLSTGKYVTVNEGETAGFAIIPNKGYRIANVVVNGKSVGAKNYYVFKDVRSNQTIHATFTKTGHVNPQTGIVVEAELPQ